MRFSRLGRCARCLRLALFTSFLSLLTVPAATGQVNILTNKMDNARSGQNTQETLLTTVSVNSTQFGKLLAIDVDGYVSAQPLYMSALAMNGGTHNVVFVATEHNSVYALDADTGAQLWKVNLGPSVPVSVEGCPNVTAVTEIGILSTPVIDPASNTIYLTSKTYVNGDASHSLHALDITTGAEKLGGPVTVSGAIGSLSFTPLTQKQRPGLLLSNGTLYLGYGSNGCDFNARGWLFAYDPANLQQVAVMATQPDNSYGSSIWQGGVGPAADSAGNVYFSTANGDFNYSLMDLGDSVLKVSMNGGTLNVLDYFTPFDQAAKAASDQDLGSGGVTLLPPQTGSSTPNLLVTSSKDGALYLINTDNMGGYNPVDNSQIVQYTPAALAGRFFGSPLYWNNTVFLLAHQDYIRSFSLRTDSNGQTSLAPLAQTSLKLTNNASPVISANGTTNGIVWIVQTVSSIPQLTAYDGVSLSQLYNSSMNSSRDALGTTNPHFATPTVANGKIYAGTQTQLVVYGLLPEINPNGGNNQTALAGTKLPNPISILAVDPYTGKPLSGVNVTFDDGGKQGTFSSPTAVTDSNGQASTMYTLPATPQTLTITAFSSASTTASFTEQGTATQGVAALSVVSGGKQVGIVGTTLPLPVVIKAKDAAGKAFPGASISFSDGLAGTFSPNPAVTSSTGLASTTYTLPTFAKTIAVAVSTGSLLIHATEQAKPDSAATINIVQGNNQTAHPNNKLPKTLIVSLIDKYGNGIPGLTITFNDNNAGGVFSTLNPLTNSLGRVTYTYTTPPQKGTVAITATYSTLAPAVFTETVN